ncbi:MAG: hypothetical protein J5787_01125 [Alphaproteobacteria bacterium]|nr:hypothetical protein [Alphaproteobacteria bacterium]MBO4643917.1 hypothetical protein [Alphaproteobacteria bacterium]
MSWLEEAQQKIKQKQEMTAEQSFAPENQEQREQLVKRLKMLYDNATEREIEKAIDDALDKFEPPYEEKAFMNFLRTKLED